MFHAGSHKSFATPGFFMVIPILQMWTRIVTELQGDICWYTIGSYIVTAAFFK